ncbi:phage major capsid protein [Escherichia coli]|nr:phage major capsid protein [Escherichia coli]EHC5853068.1 phage major capsid protein [Escherichia coli]
MSRKSYPNVNAANQYARDVVRGKIVACQFVIQACQRHLDDLMAEKSKSFRYRFDKDLAERAAKFIQLLPHTKGEWAFKRMPITLEPWQLFVICCAFGWVNKGSRLRRFREVYTEIPRKNGKSAISAGVALYCFACDNEFGAEVYSGATTEKQAWEVFRPARLMCKRTPMLTEAFGIEVNASNMNRPEDGARFEPLIGTDEDGGYAVPEELDRNILNLLKDEVVMRQEATVITVGGSDYKKLVNLGGTASGWVGETDTRSQTATSRLELIEPLMGEIYGNPQATQKMLDDAFFNVEAWINSELATEFAEQEEIAFTSGDGTKKPKGFLAYESTDETDKVRAFGKLQHIVSGEATAVTADAIIKLIYTLRKAHRTGAKFMMNNNSLFAIRLLKDSEGNYLWRPGLELGQPSSLAGYGIAENEQMPDIAADAKAIAFGNFKRGYTIVDRIGTRILRDPYTNKPFVGFYTTKRTGGMLVDSQAIKLLKIAVA